MPVRDEAWPEGTPCWIDAQLDDLDKGQEFYAPCSAGRSRAAPTRSTAATGSRRWTGRPVAGLGPKPGPMPSVWSTYIAVDDADATAATITEAGGQLMMPVFDVGPMGRMTFATDVNGAAFGIWQQLQHRGVGVFNEPEHADLERAAHPLVRRGQGVLRRGVRLGVRRHGRRDQPELRGVQAARRGAPGSAASTTTR